MLEYRRESRRVHRSIWGAVALLILLGFLLQNVAGSAYYALVMEPSTTVTSPPVELQNGTAVNSTSTIYTNSTSALVSVEPSGAGVTDVEDYVDNNTSDVDSSADKGTHSNFTAQKYGPDSVNDTLTETSASSEWLDVNAYDSTYMAWAMTPPSPYLNASDAAMISTSVQDEQHGWFDFPNTTLTSTLNVNISIYCNNNDGAGDDWADVYVDYTGSGAGSDVGDVAQHTSWQYDTIDLGTHNVSEVNNLRVYFHYKKSGQADTVSIDHARIGVYNSSELDLEVQWTNVDYDEPYEFLCIYGGPMNTENIRVDVWNGSGWENRFLDLDPGWNNKSVGDYLTSSNFTIRYRGGTETGDTTVSTWKIDAALLHVWSGGEVLGSETTVSTNATSKAVSYGKDRAVLRTTDANNTLHLFQIDSTNSSLYWWKSTDNGTTWNAPVNSSLGSGTIYSFSVAKDSSNNIHLVYQRGSGAVYYRKQSYNATDWGTEVMIYTSSAKHPDVAIAPYNNNWVYVAYARAASSGPVKAQMWVKVSTNGGSSFDGGTELTYNEPTSTTAGTFPSLVIDNTLDTYGHIYLTWFRGETNLYLLRGNITSTGTVNWDGTPQTISSGMSSASTTENTNMMHSAMYVNGKYRVVYVESGTTKYRDWDETSWSTPMSLATVSHYPSITYDWNNYTYVFYHTNASNANFDIRYQRSVDTTPTGFGNAQNVTTDNNGNKYVSTKLGGDNNRVEFAWTYNTSSPYSVKYNYIEEGAGGGPGQDDFNYVLKFLEKDNSNWKVRLTAYDQSNIARLDNLTIYIYDGSNSTQIIILSGAYNQQTGPWYDLTALDTEYIWMHVETSSAGTSYVYTYLEILVPNSTVYARYIITFEIT